MRKFLFNDVYFFRKYELKLLIEGEREGCVGSFGEGRRYE